MSTAPCDQTLPLLCGECGTRHFPGQNTLCPGWRPAEASEEVPEAVATEVVTACSDDPTNKSHDHFRTRRKLFEEVDRLIRGRVRAVLPEVTLEFKQQIDKDLGLDALRRRVNTLADGVNKTADGVAADLEAVRQQMETMLQQRADQMVQAICEDAASKALEIFTNRAQALVAKEVGHQIGRLLAPKMTAARLDTKEYRVRVRAKKTSKPKIKRAP